jgi:IMP cyclohydrolase
MELKKQHLETMQGIDISKWCLIKTICSNGAHIDTILRKFHTGVDDTNVNMLTTEKFTKTIYTI